MKFDPMKLRRAREANNLSRQRLAFQLAERGRSIDPQTIYRWERGDHNPSSDDLGLVASVLGCSVGDFFSPERPSVARTA